MALPYRQEKLASQIVKDVSQILQRELKDPRMGFVSITRVKLTADLSQAHIFISILGSEKQKKLSMSALRHAQGFVQHKLSRMLAIRQCPEIHFERDDSIEKTIKLTKKIEDLAKEREAREKGEEHVAEKGEEE